MARKFNSNINNANVFEVFSAADDKGAQLKLLGGLTVKELRAIAKDLRIKITSGRRRKFDIVVTIAEAVLNRLEAVAAAAEERAKAQEAKLADQIKTYYMTYKVADLKKVLAKENVKGRSKLTRKADMIEALIKLGLSRNK